MDDSEQCLNRLGEEMKGKVVSFVSRLRECTRTHCDTNGPAIQKNISRICQDQARLHDARCGIEGLMQENDPFRFIEVRRVFVIVQYHLKLILFIKPHNKYHYCTIYHLLLSLFQAYKTTGKQ